MPMLSRSKRGCKPIFSPCLYGCKKIKKGINHITIDGSRKLRTRPARTFRIISIISLSNTSSNHSDEVGDKNLTRNEGEVGLSIR